MFLMKDQEISGASWSWHFKQVNGSIWANIEPNMISPRTSGRPPLTWPQCSRSSFWREPVRTRRTTRRGCGWAWSPCHRWQRWLIIHTELIEETRNNVWNNNDLLQPMPVLPAESPPPQSRSDQLVTLLAASQHAASSPPAGDPPHLLHTSHFLTCYHWTSTV